MQAAELAYLPGLALWGVMLATTITTAMWLDAQVGVRLLRWEWSRLTGIAALTGVAALGGFPVPVVASGAGYVALNAAMVLMLARRATSNASVPAAA